MAEGRDFEGKDLTEAIQAAAARLGVPEAELDYEIVEQGRKGLFGLGAKSVRIRVVPTLDSPPAIEPRAVQAAPPVQRRPGAPPRERPPAPGVEISDEQARKIEQGVQRMLDLMGLALSVSAATARGGVALTLAGEDQRLMQHKDGELLLALQFLLNRMARRAWGEVGRIHLSCDSGRRQRDDDLVELTREVAQQVSRTGRPKSLHPMNAYERRLVHLTVREFGGLTSRSEGEGMLKCVWIAKE